MATDVERIISEMPTAPRRVSRSALNRGVRSPAAGLALALLPAALLIGYGFTIFPHPIVWWLLDSTGVSVSAAVVRHDPNSVDARMPRIEYEFEDERESVHRRACQIDVAELPGSRLGPLVPVVYWNEDPSVNRVKGQRDTLALAIYFLLGPVVVVWRVRQYFRQRRLNSRTIHLLENGLPVVGVVQAHSAKAIHGGLDWCRIRISYEFMGDRPREIQFDGPVPQKFSSRLEAQKTRLIVMVDPDGLVQPVIFPFDLYDVTAEQIWVGKVRSSEVGTSKV